MRDFYPPVINESWPLSPDIPSFHHQSTQALHLLSSPNQTSHTTVV